jgi:hypothetical protein
VPKGLLTPQTGVVKRGQLHDLQRVNVTLMALKLLAIYPSDTLS